LEAQGLSVREFSQRSGLGISHIYQILRGQRARRLSADTLDAFARGLGLTPAEMAAGMGRGTSPSPEDIEWIALGRRVPADKVSAAKDMLRGLAVQPTQQRAKTRTDGPAKRYEQRQRELLTGVELEEQKATKRRQFAITPTSTSLKDVLYLLLAALSPNRNVPRAALPA
jgi:transcriptional regulator with XRE-family HTH domain